MKAGPHARQASGIRSEWVAAKSLRRPARENWRDEAEGKGQRVWVGAEEGGCGIFRCVAARRRKKARLLGGGSKRDPERTAQAQTPGGRLGPRPLSCWQGRSHPPPSCPQQHGPGGTAPRPQRLQYLATDSRKYCSALRKRFPGPPARPALCSV